MGVLDASNTIFYAFRRHPWPCTCTQREIPNFRWVRISVDPNIAAQTGISPIMTRPDVPPITETECHFIRVPLRMQREMFSGTGKLDGSPLRQKLCA